MSQITAQRLKMLRTKKGLSQVELAKLTDISNSTIAMLETNKRDGNNITFKILSDFFDVPIEYLAGRETQQDDLRDFLMMLDTTKDGKIRNEDIPELVKRAESYISKLNNEEESN